MNRIIFPLKPDMVSNAVGDLHLALKVIDYEISERERITKTFGSSTREAIKELQRENRLRSTGEVDETTANIINGMLRDREIVTELQVHRNRLESQGKSLTSIDGRIEGQGKSLASIDSKLGNLEGIDSKLVRQTEQMGAIGIELGKHTGKLGRIETELGEHTTKLGKIEAGVGEIGDTSKFQGVVRGQVRIETGKPFPGCIVRAFHVADQGKVRLGEDTTDAEGCYTIRYSMLPGVKSIHLAIIVFDVHGKPLCKPKLFDEVKPLEMVDFVVPMDGKPDVKRGIEGQIILEHGLPAEKLKLRLYRRDFGGKATLLDETITLTGGQYAFSYNSDGKTLSLEVRAVKGANEEIVLSEPMNDLGDEPHAVLNLVAPGTLQPLEAEYRRLSKDLKPYVGELKNLANARENAGRQDLTVLNRATGWDARLIALSAFTEQISADPEVKLPQEAVYGLLRAGLPSDKLLLAQVEPDVAEQALKTVRDEGIVELTDPQIGEFKKVFTTFSNTVRLNIPAPGSRSTYGALLKTSGLPQDAQDKFVPIYLNHCGDAAQLWEEARHAGLDEAQILKLQLQGKFAFLAGNSEAMTERLMKKQINDPAQLVEQDLHRAYAWVTEVFEHAGIPANRHNNLTDADKKKLDELIPTAYAAEKVEDRMNAYTEDMARKVRLSYPTQVVGRLMETDGNFKLPAAHDATVTLLKNAAGQGFRLGETPVAAFLKTHTGVTAGMDAPVTQATQQQLQTLQRVYQITPSNEAMPVLLILGMSSAYDVMAYPEAEFVALFEAKYQELYKKPPASGLAKMVSRKAKQVSSVTYNLFTIAKKLESDPPVAGMSASVEVRESVCNELIKKFPTMESLFGAMDFCECEHCRSVLSPAAYLVDLLQFIDIEPGVWDNFLDTWSKNHRGHAYTGTYTLNGQQFMGKYKKPYDALIERRPDLPHIPLTCENTHTALPYIDIVNEILEYYVAYGKLEDTAAHDTGEATTAELLAEPQNVIRGSYDKLREACYPINLPFDLWIETVRQFCNYFETPLDRVLETFRQSNDLFAPAQPFDRSAIFIESLGLSPAEAAIFNDPDPLVGNKWHELYGFPADISIQNPTNVGNATLTVANSEASKLWGGLSFAYFDVSADTLSADYRRIQTLGALDSGGAGQILITLDGVWGVSPAAGDLLVCVEPEALRSAKTLSRCLGVTYKEIAEIIQTGFVNPKLTKMVLLYKLGLTIQDADFYKDHKTFYEQNSDLLGKDRSSLTAHDQKRFDALSEKDPQTKKTGWEDLNEVQAFEQRLKDLADEFNFPLAQLEAEVQAIPFDSVLVLADPDSGCNFDETTLQYANGDTADAIAFLRINLFVRLWRKLGWTIEETDHALQAFVPKNSPFEKDHLAKQPLKTALIYLAHLKVLDEKIRVGKQSRIKLITLWTDIATTGKNPLYAKLFLTRSMLKSGEAEIVLNGQTHILSVFDDPLGKYLLPAKLTEIAGKVRHEVCLNNIANTNKIDEDVFAGEQKIGLRYDDLGEVQYLTYIGVLSDQEKARLAALSPSDELSELLGAVQVKAKEFTLIKGHLLALQGALGLTADEISHILVDTGKSLDTSELSLPNASLLYRYRLMAQALKLSVRELITLKQLSGYDPFKLLHPDPLSTIEVDHPFSQTLRFVEIAEEVKESGLKIEDLDYLLRHRFDETGKYRPNNEGTLALLKTLAEGVCAISAEHPVPDDPGALSKEVLRQKLGLILQPDVVECFLAMMNGTVEFTATKTGVEAEDALEPETFSDESLIRQVSYKEVPHKEQKLTLRGVLFDAQKTELQTRFDAVLTTQQKPVFAELLSGVQALARNFFDNQLRKQKLRLDGEAGFLENSDFDALFIPLKSLKKILPTDTPQEVDDKLKENEDIEQENQATLQQRRYRIAKAFLPYLQQRLIRQFIVQTMTAHTGADPALVESLVTDERLLAMAGSKPLLASFAATGERGVSAAFFDSDDLSSAAQATTSVVRSADTALKDTQDTDGNPLNHANSAWFEGYLEVPTPGTYRFYIELDKQNAEADLRFDHLPDPVFLQDAAASDNTTLGEQPDEFIELKPGIPYRFSLELKKLGGGAARLLVQGETLPKAGVSQLTLYPLSAMAVAERALLLLAKVLQIIQSLGLSEREARYLLTHSADFGNLNLSELPTEAVDDTPAEKAATTQRFARLLRLFAYARLKRDLAGGTDDLIGIFEANGAGDLDNVYALVAKLTRRDEATVKASAKALFAAPAFASEESIQRLWGALQIVERFGVTVKPLLEWTRIVSTAATPEQRFDISRDLKEAIKARFEHENWQRVAQPIFDRLRQRQRDALVAHVMHQHRFSRMEQLYEYFLIDPGMEPVVQTSRIRLAISSLQLFIQRCLLNLELKVHPSTINSKHWEWMKRYRVWEANRKIFLFPENWLEPEFRDDKTHLFAELEGVLLQGDVSSDLVEDAFLNYLKKLDELARLDIMAMHIEDDTDPARRTLHVFGRTYSHPHKYFYRRYAHQMWTPWEPVSAEIEGDHLAPVIWRDRLYLFWVTFMDKPDPKAKPAEGPKDATGNEKTVTNLKMSEVVSSVANIVGNKIVEVQLHWSEYMQGEWSTRESGGFSAVISKSVSRSFKPSSVFIHVSKDDAGEESGVYITLGGVIKGSKIGSFYLAGRNSLPEKKGYRNKPANLYNANDVQSTRYGGDSSLTVTFKQRITTEGKEIKVVSNPLSILQKGTTYSLLPCNNDITLGGPAPGSLDADKADAVAKAIEAGLPEIASLIKPVFYQNNADTLFVEPNVTERTIEEWEEWVTSTPQPEPGWRILEKWPDVVVIPQTPWKPPFPDPGDPWRDPIDPGSLINPRPGEDWLVNPLTGLRFDNEVIGPSGRAGIVVLPSHEVAEAVPNDALLANIHIGSDLPMGTVAVVPSTVLDQAGITKVAGGLNVVGGAGFSSELAQNLNELNRSRFDAGRSGHDRIGR